MLAERRLGQRNDGSQSRSHSAFDWVQRPHLCTHAPRCCHATASSSRLPERGPDLGLNWLGGFANAVGMRPRAGQLAAIHDQILLADRAILKPAFKDGPGPGGVAGLSG